MHFLIHFFTLLSLALPLLFTTYFQSLVRASEPPAVVLSDEEVGEGDIGTILVRSWDTYKKTFINEEGATVDPYQSVTQRTTSEGQSYSLLRAVMMNDRETFDRVLKFTNTQMKRNDGTYAWHTPTDMVTVDDINSAPDGDTMIAAALLVAYQAWGEDAYRRQANDLLDAIWEELMSDYGSARIVTAGQWAEKETYVVVNPSYLMPAFYRMFAEVDTEHDWRGVIDATYDVLAKCTISRLDKETAVLAPEWCAIDRRTLAARVADAPDPQVTEYGYNAFRIPWHVALDFQMSGDERARQYLGMLDFLGRKWREEGKVSTGYTHDGTVSAEYESVAAYSGNLGYFVVMDNATAQKLYLDKIVSRYNVEGGYWDDPQNYYTQNWAWFGSALVGGLFEE